MKTVRVNLYLKFYSTYIYVAKNQRLVLIYRFIGKTFKILYLIICCLFKCSTVCEHELNLHNPPRTPPPPIHNHQQHNDTLRSVLLLSDYKSKYGHNPANLRLIQYLFLDNNASVKIGTAEPEISAYTKTTCVLNVWIIIVKLSVFNYTLQSVSNL